MTLASQIMVLAVVGIILWGLLESYVLSVERHNVVLPHLPEAWKGQRIALISDLHVGMWLANTATVRKAVKRIVQERPTLVLIAGDFVHHESEHVLAQVTALLSPLTQAGLRCYAVLGNHDYGMPEKGSERNEELVRRLKASLEKTGICVLHNSVVRLELPQSEAALYLVGLAAYTPDEDEPVSTVMKLPSSAARIVLMHHPNSFAALPANSAPLALAGHTHGGQIRLLGKPVWHYLGKHKGEVLSGGWIKDYGAAGNHLYVSRGIGFSVAPLRLNCPPELTLFTLV